MENSGGLQFRSSNLADRYITDPHKPRRPLITPTDQVVQQAVPIAQRVLNIEEQRQQVSTVPLDWFESPAATRQRGLPPEEPVDKKSFVQRIPRPQISFKTIGAVAAGVVLVFGFVSLITGLRVTRPPADKMGVATTKMVSPINIEPITAVAGATAYSESENPEDTKGVGPISEDKPTDTIVERYSATSSHLRYLSVPAIGITKARVMRSAVGGDGKIEFPANIWDAGWYESSALPADRQGSVLIIGHVKGETSRGLFYDLYRIKIDDEITLTLGDGTIMKYRVVSKEDVLSDNIDENGILRSRDTSNASLTLLTAMGEQNPTTGVYEKRQAVFAIRTN